MSAFARLVNSTADAAPATITGKLDTRGPEVISVAVPFTIAIVVIVALRLYVRLCIVKRTGWDDYTIVLATCGGVALGIVSTQIVNFGLGRWMRDIPPQWIMPGLKLTWINQMIYNPTVAVVKISICLFLLRLAPTTFYRRYLWSTLIFMATYTVACTLNIAFQCLPAYYFYDRRGPGKCMPTIALMAVAYTHGAVNILTDVMLVALPIPMLWNVQISGRQKIAIWLTLSVGLFAAAASCVKLTYLVNYKALGMEMFRSTDLTIWSIIEIDTGIIVASIPSLKPLFKKFLEVTGYGYGSRNRTEQSVENPRSASSFGKTSHKLQSLPSSNGNSTHVVVGKSRRGRDMLSASDSQEEIFQYNGIGITKTTEVVIDVHETGSVESDCGSPERNPSRISMKRN